MIELHHRSNCSPQAVLLSKCEKFHASLHICSRLQAIQRSSGSAATLFITIWRSLHNMRYLSKRDLVSRLCYGLVALKLSFFARRLKDTFLALSTLWLSTERRRDQGETRIFCNREKHLSFEETVSDVKQNMSLDVLEPEARVCFLILKTSYVSTCEKRGWKFIKEELKATVKHLVVVLQTRILKVSIANALQL